jgi:FlaA1/EpsC-like NDP-sugar epimerase
VLDQDVSVSRWQIPVYVLDMGEPVVIDRLAKRLINFVGLRWDDHIDITYAELRFGDKESEELESLSEQLQATSFPKIKRARLNVTLEEKKALSRLLGREV